MDDLSSFLGVEVFRNGGLVGVDVFTVVVFSLCVATFWNSVPSQAALIYMASSFVAYFCLNPYLLTLSDWRNTNEKAEALLHSSKRTNKLIKTTLTLLLFLPILLIEWVISLIEWECVNGVVDGFDGGEFFVGMLVDALSLISPFLFFCVIYQVTI